MPTSIIIVVCLLLSYVPVLESVLGVVLIVLSEEQAI